MRHLFDIQAIQQPYRKQHHSASSCRHQSSKMVRTCKRTGSVELWRLLFFYKEKAVQGKITRF